MEFTINPDEEGSRSMTGTLPGNDKVDATESSTSSREYQPMGDHDEGMKEK
jgi:hypothetical protein